MKYNEIIIFFLLSVRCCENRVGEPNWIRNAGVFFVAVLFLFACVRERLLGFFCLNLLAQRHFYFLSSEQNCFVFPEVTSAAQKSESGGFLFVLKFCLISIIS